MRRKKEPTLYDWFDVDGNLVDAGLSFADATFIYGSLTGLTRKVSTMYMATDGWSQESIDATAVTHS